MVKPMRRVRPDDDFMFLTDTDETPMQIGALQFYEVAGDQRDAFFTRVRDHLARRLPRTPLLCVLQRAPDDFDSAVWLERRSCDFDLHVTRVAAHEPMSETAVNRFVAAAAMRRLDLKRPPFRVEVLDNLQDGRCAVLILVHHAFCDGVGFQAILQALTDGTPDAGDAPAPDRQDEAAPSDSEWMAKAEARFAAEAGDRDAWKVRRRAAVDALAALDAESPERPVTPTLKLSGATSRERAYATLALPLGRIRALGKELDATVNDLFLTIAGGALRRYLIEIDDLPHAPLVINSARSYRRPEHGDLGNRIVALHPHLGTHIAHPIERLRAVQASMRAELRRSQFDEQLLDSLESPFGPRDRRQAFAKRLASGARVLPGNVTLSNVPGPSAPRFLAGFRQLSNYPTPLLGSGRFLNITLRRNVDQLDLGIMADPTKLSNLGRFLDLLSAALEEIERALQQAPLGPAVKGTVA